MNAMNVIEDTAVTAAYKIDPSRGSRDGNVSRQWMSRPDDQRFLSLDTLAAHVKNRSSSAVQKIVDVKNIVIEASFADAEKLTLNHEGVNLSPTNWSFGQLSSLANSPAGYLRKLPASIAAINLQYGLQNLRSENTKLYYDENELYAATGTEYGRVLDIELVNAVQKIAGSGTGETRWKIPGVMDWSTHKHNPFVDPTKDTTTLYASDRDVFMFLVDDTHPIEIGKLPNGDPDLIFRGFYVWNSEVGSKTLGISTFMLRGVCQNRNIWGQEDKHSLIIRHSKNAPNRFAQEAEPALLDYSTQSSTGILYNINLAKSAVVASNDDERTNYLKTNGFNAKQAQHIINTVIKEEDVKPKSIWDFVQGVTAVARDVKHTDERIQLEMLAGKMMSKAIH